MNGMRVAVVLALHAHRNRLTVLDEILGKLELTCLAKHGVVRGALIEYMLVEWRNSLQAQHIDIVAVPQHWVIHDIIFLHQIIELSLFFLPESQDAHEVYELFKVLYRPCMAKTSLVKKLILCRLLFLLHLYDEKAMNLEFFSLISGSWDSMFERDDADLEKKASVWLERSLALHVPRDRLKTFSYTL